jgi:Fe-S oxidoreductase/nitrate reductase gamma subunit
MNISTLVFVLLVVLGTGFFSYNAQRLVRYLGIGHPENRTNDLETRTRNLFSIGILQSKILRDPVAGAMHATVFWGFIVLTIGTIEIFIQGVAPGFTYAGWFGKLYGPYVVMQEVFAFGVLAAVAWLFYRRLVIRPKRLQGDKLEQSDALLILSMIALLMITLFLTTSFTEVAAPHSLPATRFISRAIAGVLAGIPRGTAVTIATVSWWAHVVLVLVFLNYLPYSKHLHVITSLPNVFLSNTSGPGRIGVMRPMDLEAEGVEHFGAADVDQLSWKNLLDGFSCTECGRCTAACPANITGKLLSPRKIVINVRERTLEKAPMLVGASFDGVVETAGDLVHGEGEHEPEGRLLDTFITEEELWACTSCRACVQECPVSIDQLDTINELRRHLVLMESRFPAEIQPAFQSLERNGTPWAFNAADRGEWAEGMRIPTMAEMAAVGKSPEVLFWVGCMGSFDARAKKITVSFARIMQAAGIDFAILGQEERCNGDPARRMGNEYLYQMLAKATIEQLNGYGVRTVVTICPHCFHQMGNEYPDLGGHYEVVHHSVYIERLLAEGRVPLSEGNGSMGSITYHDSCYLGRYNDVYDAPREALRRVLPVVAVVEPERHRSRGLCCGAGGGRMWMEETQGTRINMERTKELLATGAETIAAACPFCMTMLTDGVKAHDSTVPVLDIAEVVAARLASVPAPV